MVMLAIGLISTGLVGCGQTEESADQDIIDSSIVEVLEEGDIVEEEDDVGHHDELPFEWSGSYVFEKGTYTLLLNHNEFGDESMLISFILENGNILDFDHHAAHIMDIDPDEEVDQDGSFDAVSEYSYNLALNPAGSTSFTFTITEAGRYKIFTEHVADEFDMNILHPSGDVIPVEDTKTYDGNGHSHEDDSVHTEEEDHSHE